MDEMPVKSASHTKLLIFLIVIMLLLTGAVVFDIVHQAGRQKIANAYPADASQVFDKMLQNTQTTAFETEQHITRDPSGKQVLKTITTLDLTDMANVRAYGTMESNNLPGLPGVEIKNEIIAIGTDAYVRYDKLSSTKVWDGWFSVDKDSKPDTNGSSLFFFGDPAVLNQLYFGFYIPGVYGHETRAAAYDFYKAESPNNPYQFFSEHVRAKVMDGKKYYKYDMDITNSVENTLKLNKAIAQSLGIKLTGQTLASIQEPVTSLSFWVNPDSQRLERVDVAFQNRYTETVYYYGYNVISDINVPMPVQDGTVAKKLIQPSIDGLGKQLGIPKQTD